MVINFDGGENETKLIREYKHFLESVIRRRNLRAALVNTGRGRSQP